MESFIGILAIVAVVAISLWLASLRDRAVSSAVGAANRRLQPNKHAEGQAFVDTVHVFGISAPTNRIVDTLASQVTSRTSAPTVSFGETFLVSTGVDQVEWAHGTSLQISFRAVARVGEAELADDTKQTIVALQYFEATLADGLVADLASMKKLKAAVQAALTSIDAGVEEMDFL
jgi:hypothetical protein